MSARILPFPGRRSPGEPSAHDLIVQRIVAVLLRLGEPASGAEIARVLMLTAPDEPVDEAAVVRQLNRLSGPAVEPGWRLVPFRATPVAGICCWAFTPPMRAALRHAGFEPRLRSSCDPRLDQVARGVGVE